MIASAKEKDALNITLSSCINFTNVHLCNYCTKIFVIVVNACVCRRSVDNKAAILSYPILSFDNFLTPLRVFRPWKALVAVNNDAAYHFFPLKWRWLTPEHLIYLLLRISRARSRPRLRIKELHYSTIASIWTRKTTVLLTYREAKGKNQQWGKQNIHFLWVAGKRNLQYYITVLSTMRHAIYTHGCIYTNFWVAPANQKISLSWYMKKIFSKYLKSYIFIKSAKVSGF